MGSLFLSMHRLVFPIVVTLLLISCAKPHNTDIQPAPGNRYASGFMLQDSADACIVTIFSPWERTQVMARYVLSSSSAKAMPPVHRLAVTSCTHVGMLAALHALDGLVGVCQPSLVYTDLSACPMAQSPDFDLGDGMSPSVERIMWHHPDAVMLSVYNRDDVTASRLTALGVPVIYNNEWMESHPLARAEWIRLVGAFVGKRHEADSIFSEVVARYQSLCEVARTRRQAAPHPVSIMSGQDFRGTWYVPSGATYMGQLFHDAGADYAYATHRQEGSVPLTMEQALQDFSAADVWVGVNARTWAELKEASSKHTWFQSYQSGRVYNFLGRSNTLGANDFWERGVVHPDEILQDLIYILYPDTMDNQSSGRMYISPLQP